VSYCGYKRKDGNVDTSFIISGAGEYSSSVVLEGKKVNLRFGDVSVYIKTDDIPDFITDLQKCFWVALKTDAQAPQEQVA
jgi:hypothetical protein